MAGGSDDLAHRVGTLETRVDDGFRAVDARFAAVDARFAAVDARFATVDARFDAVETRFDAVDAALVEQRQYTEFSHSQLTARMDAGFSRLERKLDQFVDAQSKTNALVERRLNARERRPRRP